MVSSSSDAPWAPLAPFRRYRRLMSYVASDAESQVFGRPGSLPLSGSGKKTPAVMCIHGYGGVPGEVELVFDVAQKLGHPARAPLLPGHGTRPSDLAALRFEDWVAGARQTFNELRADGPVILVGLSLGSLVATALTLESPGDVCGLVLLSNAFWLGRPFPGSLLRAVDALGLPDFGVAKAHPDLGDVKARAGHVSYPVHPVKGAISVLKAGEALAEELFRVHCPTLIVHGAKDRVCPVQNAWRAAERIEAVDARVVILPRSHHIITRDLDHQVLADEVRRFIKRVRKNPTAHLASRG